MKNRYFTFAATLLAFIWIGFVWSAKSFGVVPPPDGGYPGGNTAEGQNALLNLTNGTFNTAVGFLSLRSNADGSFNTALGAGTLLLNIGDQATGEGIENTATGAAALLNNTTGATNTANGAFALFSNTTGSNNCATGFNTLFSNSIGTDNCAFGLGALASNTTASFNTAIGARALVSNSIGHNNTAAGGAALFSSTTGSSNTATGSEALFHNTTGDFNTAVGSSALVANVLGSNNTAIGSASLSLNTVGGNNTSIGFEASRNNTSGTFNTAVGHQALFNNTTGTGNTALGVNGGGTVTTASNVIAIGTTGANVSNSCFIGNIREVTTANNNAVPVLIDSAGQLGTTSSSRRFKREVQPMAEASEAVLGLRPVTFRYKTDNTDTPQFGLIAEDVAKVNGDLVVRDNTGQIYTVRYDAVNVMLLNEFLKEHKKVEQQARELREQKAAINTLTSRLDIALTRLPKPDPLTPVRVACNADDFPHARASLKMHRDQHFGTSFVVSHSRSRNHKTKKERKTNECTDSVQNNTSVTPNDRADTHDWAGVRDRNVSRSSCLLE